MHYPHEQQPLFRNPDVRAASHMWGEDAIYATWKTATEAAGLPWVPPYQSMKHTQVSALRAAGIPIDDIVEQCRWATPAMMEHYDDAQSIRAAWWTGEWGSRGARVTRPIPSKPTVR